MLSPESRTVAVELLRPPVGYDLNFALLTTYTLDLETLLALPLGVIARADRGVEDLLADPLLLLEALREVGERIHVFVDRAGIAIPHRRRELYAMLEPSLHPVRAPGKGAFHPKVWVLRFLAEKKPPLLRVAILSRNLTFDRCWDTALASEASPTSKQGVGASRPLADLIRRLPGMSAERLKPEVVEQMQTLADEVRRTRFPAPDGFSDDPIEFHVFGLRRRRRPWRPMTGGSRTLAVAPFVSRTALDTIVDMGDGERMLVSRQEELDKLPDDALAQWSRKCVLSDDALDEPEDALVEPDDALDERGNGTGTRPSGLHAKIIAVESGWNVTWYVGSANLTAAAFTGKNVEIMAAVTARKGRYGIERFLESGFDKLCTTYQRHNPEAGGEGDEALQHLEEARDTLLDADLKVVCTSANDGWTWRLEGPALPIQDDIEVAVWPISVAEEHARRLDLPLTWRLPIQQLTGLVAFHLHVAAEGVDDIRLTLRLPAEGIPADRMHHILRILINNPERFLRFLRALLGGLEGMIGWARGEGDGSSVWGAGLHEETLLEDLVRVASREPERLEPVRKLIDDFRRTEEGRQIVPDELFSVWTAVDGALRKRGRS